MQICGSFVEYICFSGKKESENCRQKLTDSLKYAKSIAQLTPELKKEFLEVCVRKKISMNFISCFDILCCNPLPHPEGYTSCILKGHI